MGQGESACELIKRFTHPNQLHLCHQLLSLITVYRGGRGLHQHLIKNASKADEIWN